MKVMPVRNVPRLAALGLIVAGSAMMGGVALRGQDSQSPTAAFVPRDPTKELAMKITGPFTLAAVGDITDYHPMAQLDDPKFQDLIKHLRDADVGFADMERSILTAPYSPNSMVGLLEPKTVISELKAMGIRVVTQANNHAMDGGAAAILSTSDLLDDAGIVHVGAGKDLQDARAAHFLDTPKGTVGAVGIFSIDPGATGDLARATAATYRRGDYGGATGLNGLHLTTYNIVTADQLADLRKIRDAVYARRGEVPVPVDPVTPNEPADRLQLFGTSYRVGSQAGGLSYTMNPQDLQDIMRSIRNGKEYADFMIVTIHCHQNSYSFQHYSFDNGVPDFLVDLAHKAIDNGADAFIGHGVHTLRGVEIYKGKPIFYGVSNFVFQETQGPKDVPAGNLTEAELGAGEMDWVQQPDNLEAVLATSHYEDGRLVEVRLYPADLGKGKTRPTSRMGIPMTPSPEVAQEILQKMQRISKQFGTTIAIDGNVGVIHVAPGASRESQAGQGMAGK